MKSNEYWRDRAIENERHWYEKTDAFLNEKIKRYYEESLSAVEKEIAQMYARYAGENGLTMHEARRLIKGREFERWRMSLLEYAADNELGREINTLAARTRINRLEMLKGRTLIELAKLSRRVNHDIEALFIEAYLEAHYRQLYEVGREVGLKYPAAAVSTAALEKVMRSTWSGANYSERVWKNAVGLGATIEKTLVQGLHRGTSIQKLSKALEKRFRAGYSNCERLIRTEMNYVQTRGALEALSGEFECYRYIAALDNRTCSRCGSLDGKVCKLSEALQGENAPPLHPRCRCTIAPKVEGTRLAGRRRIPASVSYKEWRKSVENKTGDKGITLSEWNKTRALITPVKTVANAATFAEFKTYWAENYNVSVSDEITGLEFGGVKLAAQAIERVLREFPSAAKMLTEFRVIADDKIMSTSYKGQIAFNPNYFDSLIKLSGIAKKDAESGFHPKNTGVLEYGAHEAGHILELALIENHGGNIDNWNKGTYARKIVRTAYEFVAKNEDKSIYQLRMEISDYAADYKRIGECLAEAVADYIANGDTAARLSKAIWQILKKEL